MREIVLASTMVLLFLIGYHFMKKVDLFLCNTRTASCAITDTLTLSIAFEYPEDIVLMKDTVTSMLENNPGDDIVFFYGTYDEIKHNIEWGKLDIGVLNYNKQEWNNQEVGSEKLELLRKNIQYSECKIQLEQLEPEPIERIIVWKKCNSNNLLSAFIKNVTAGKTI